MKKDYIKPQILMERMQFCNMIAASDDEIPFIPGEHDADSKRFGTFVDFEDEDEDY